MKKFLIPLNEYNRIHQVAHGVLENIAQPDKACIFFACFGALILNNHYKIPARVVAGAFGLCVDPKLETIFFGQINDGLLSSSNKGFHMWVQTETHIIDFMAPIFRESFASMKQAQLVPRKMLQRSIRTEARTLSDLCVAGAFYTLPNMDLTSELTNSFFEKAGNADLLQAAETWFGSRRLRQKSTMTMLSDDGKIIETNLPSVVATGAW